MDVATRSPNPEGEPRGLRKEQRPRWRQIARARLDAARAAREAGMATAEYAIVTVAAAGFGGLLVLILRSDEVRGLLVGIVRGALTQ
jgi:hypothetical protein